MLSSLKMAADVVTAASLELKVFGQFLLSNRDSHCFSIQNLVQTSLANISSAVLIKRTWISVKVSGEVGE